MPGEITMAGLYTTAADYINGTHYSRFLGGPDVWTAVHMVASDKVAGPLAEGFRRHVGAAQTQHWRGDEREAIRILRTLSQTAEPLPLLTELHAEHRMETARQVLRDTLGMSTGHDLDLIGLAQHLAERLAGADTTVDGRYDPLPHVVLNESRTEVVELCRTDPRFVFGAVIAVADLVGSHGSHACVRTAHLSELHPDGPYECSRWAVGGGGGVSHWELANARPLARPVPCKGALGLWDLPSDVEALVRDQLAGDGVGS